MKIGFNFSLLIISLLVMAVTSCNDEENVFVTGISLNSTDSVQIAVDSTLTLTATVSPVSATNKDIIWSTGNAGVAIVNGGVIKGILPGTTKIVATTADGAMSASVVVTVAVAVSSITLNESTLDIRIGEKGSFTCTVLPVTATNKDVIWSSNDTTVAKVNPVTGEITGVSEGKATITATTKEGEFTDMSEVTIVNPYGKEPMIALQTGERFELVRVFENKYVERFINYEFEVIPSFTAINPWNALITFENDRAVLKTLIEDVKNKGYYSETRKAPNNTEEVYQGVLSHLDGVLPPSDAYTISNTTLKAGENTAKVTYTIDKSKLYPGINIIPVKLKGVGIPFKVDPDSPVGYILVQYVPDRSEVPIKSSSSHQSVNYSPKRVAGLFDGDFDTSWRPGVGATSYPNGISNDNNPAIVVDLGAETDVSAVEFWTRGPGERQGSLTETYRVAPYITNVKVYVSSDNQCWEVANGEFLLQGTTLIKTEKPYWGAPVIDYNWLVDNPASRPCTLTLVEPKRGRYVIFWLTKSGNQMDLWELFVYGNRE